MVLRTSRCVSTEYDDDDVVRVFKFEWANRNEIIVWGMNIIEVLVM